MTKLSKSTNFNHLFLVATITAFAGQIYISPFGTMFRFSFSVVLLTVLILRFEKLSIIGSGFLTGLFVFVFRALIMTADATQGSLINIVINHYPSMVYYMIFALSIKYLNIRSVKEKAINLVAILWISDVSSNLVEVTLRGKSSVSSLEMAVTMIIIMGFGRSVISFMIFNGVKLYNTILLKEESEKRYREMLIEKSGLKTDLFFLKKNSQDIEKAMAGCYGLYEQVKKIDSFCNNHHTSQLRGKVLELTKEIHEIKKDNLRIFSSVSKLIENNEHDQDMTLSYILEVLYWNNKRMLQQHNKNIDIEFEYDKDFIIKEYYAAISVLNNLIINAIEAIENFGKINIQSMLTKDFWILRIKDDGSGISQEYIEVIFQAGFSTKFNPNTGQMSTGVGLTHVKHLIENGLKGTIEVKSNIGEGTIFTISIPREYL
jgi:two-component system, sensor histidine kinase YcbA